MTRTVYPRGRRWPRAVALLLALAVLAPLVAGAARAQERIIGGEPAAPDSMPFMAAIWWSGNARSPVCDGTLIAPRAVLTAASCLSEITIPDGDGPAWHRPVAPGEIAVTFADRDGSTGEARRIRVESVAIHPGFNLNDCFDAYYAWILNCHDDAAVLRLAAAPRGRQPVALADAGRAALALPGDHVTAAGWSGDRALARKLGPLTRADLSVTQPGLCSRRYDDLVERYAFSPPVKVDGKATFCAFRQLAGPCFEEAGGPALVRAGGAWLQVGILGPVTFCSAAKWPYLYTRVSRQLMNDWIRQAAGLASPGLVKGKAK